MSTGVPNCQLSYTKDLNELILTFNQIDITDVSNISEILLDLKLDGTSIYTDNTLYTTKIALTLTGTIDVSAGTTDVVGTNTFFLTEVNVGDIIEMGGYFHVVKSITSNELLNVNATIVNAVVGSSGTVFHNVIKLSLTDLGMTGILTDGLYTASIECDYGLVPTSSEDFTLYVYANSINCVQSKILDLASRCNDCPDMETIKYTLLLKALLDALDIAVAENDTATITMITDKIDRYCLLLDSNCTSC